MRRGRRPHNPDDITNPNVQMLEGLVTIAKYCNREHPNTPKRWWFKEGFPMAKLPDGTWVTTKSAIDSWIVYRGRAQLEKYKELREDAGMDNSKFHG